MCFRLIYFIALCFVVNMTRVLSGVNNRLTHPDNATCNKIKTRHVAVTDGVPCRLWDIDPWLTPVSLFIPQMWCKCMNYMNTLSNIKEVMQFEWKSKFDPYDPKWPRLTFDPKKDIGSQAYAYVRVTWIYYEK